MFTYVKDDAFTRDMLGLKAVVKSPLATEEGTNMGVK